MNREKAIIFLKQIIEKVSNSSTESFKSIDFYNVNSCTNDLECEDDGMNFLSTMLLKLNSQGYFLSASMDAASVYLGLPEAVSIMSPLVPSMMEKGIRNILSVWF